LGFEKRKRRGGSHLKPVQKALVSPTKIATSLAALRYISIGVITRHRFLVVLF